MWGRAGGSCADFCMDVHRPLERCLQVHPSAVTLRVIQDKFAQKEHFASAGVPVADFCAVTSEVRCRPLS